MDGRRLDILIVTPAPKRARNGNRITALRWARILRRLGHRVRLAADLDGHACDLLVALHARKSGPAVGRLRARDPGVPVVVALAGTDLYGEGGVRPDLPPALGLASRIVALQALACEALPEELRSRARVIHQSAAPPADPPARSAETFDVAVIGHLRPVKDPFRAALAARLLPADSRVRVLHAGAALAPDMEAAARAEMAANPRYRWLGPVPRRAALRTLAGCRLLALTSLQEGGANAVSEAVACGVPVVASRVDGSVGLLGDDYPGLFPAGDTAALAALLRRAETDGAFLAGLEERGRGLRPLFEPAEEERRWKALLGEIFAEPEPPPPGGRFRILGEESGDRRAEFARDVADGLSASPKRLHCRYFYDAEGSRLFEEICATPEYYVTRAEHEILW